MTNTPQGPAEGLGYWRDLAEAVRDSPKHRAIELDPETLIAIIDMAEHRVEEPAVARLCDWWLANRSKCSEPATHLTEDRHGAPLGFCDMHYGLRHYQGVEAGSDAGSTDEQVNDRNIANDHQGRGEDEA